MKKKLIIKGHDKNPFVKFWNWGWGIYYKNPELWNYLIVGLLTTIVSLAVYFACVHTFLNPKIAFELQCANVISWIIAVAFAYITNRIFVFNSVTKGKEMLKEIISFTASRLLTLFMDMGIMFITVSLLKQSDTLGKLISQVVVIVGNYVLSKLFVFKKK